jgi:hypothetical protein
MDTYRTYPLKLLSGRSLIFTRGIIKIWHYKHKTKILREKAGLPQLYDVDDLPDYAYDPNYVHVLTDREELDLHKRMFNATFTSLTLMLNTQSKRNFNSLRHGTDLMERKRIG